MGVRHSVTLGNGTNICDPIISLSGMKFTVRGGTFVRNGEEIALDNFEHEVLAVDERVSLTAFLAKNKKTGKIIVLVDERLPGVRAYRWDGDFENIFPLAYINVPGDVFQLTEADVLIMKVIKDEEEEDND